MKQNILIILSITILLSSCSGYITVQSTSTVPSGTKVAYSKVTNPAYSKDYINADIVTEVEFFAPKGSNAWQSKIPKGHIVFQVVSIGGTGKSSPFGGSALGDFVYIPKEKGDLVFNLQQGDKIQLRGGTRIRKGIVGNVEIIEFIATSITKL